VPPLPVPPLAGFAAAPRRPEALAPAIPARPPSALSAPAASFAPAASAPPATGWSVVVTADRDYYESVVAAGAPDAAAIVFPDYCSERRFQLTGPQMRIGRVSRSRGFAPEIDLTGPPTDPGISRLHAVLIPEPDGTWAILDPGSENGTQVNNLEIANDQRVRLRNGDRVHLGAWTVLTIHAD
jgi:FHA domain